MSRSANLSAPFGARSEILEAAESAARQCRASIRDRFARSRRTLNLAHLDDRMLADMGLERNELDGMNRITPKFSLLLLALLMTRQ